MPGIIRSSYRLRLVASVVLLGACSSDGASPAAVLAPATVTDSAAVTAPASTPPSAVTVESATIVSAQVGSVAPATAPSSPTSVLFDGSATGAADEWAIVNDGVMGGLSSSSVTDSADGVEFTGSVSLDNNGGFASIRNLFDEVVDLAGFSDLVIEAAGDGKTYVVELRTDENDVSYWQRFTPTSDTAPYTLPLDAFAPHSRFGEPIEGGAMLDPSRVGSVAVYILDKQAGDFRLVISRITAR